MKNRHKKKAVTFGELIMAVYSACGVRIRELPITPDKILMALASDRRNS